MNYQQNYHYSVNSPFSYVKKEDAKALLKNSRYLGIIFGVVFAVLYGVFETLIFSRLSGEAFVSGIELPFYSQSNFRYTVYFAIVALCFLIQPESEDEFDRKLSQYKEGEMILVSKLADKSYNAKIGSVIFFGFAYLMLAIVLPLSSIIESV